MMTNAPSIINSAQSSTRSRSGFSARNMKTIIPHYLLLRCAWAVNTFPRRDRRRVEIDEVHRFVLEIAAEDVQVVAVVARAHARRITPRSPAWQPGRGASSVVRTDAEEHPRRAGDRDVEPERAADVLPHPFEQLNLL